MLSNPCKPGVCQNKCYEIPEQERITLYNYFWSLDEMGRRQFSMQCAQEVPIKRKRTTQLISRRSCTFEYYINIGQENRRVCLQFLKNTLCVSARFISYHRCRTHF